MTSEFAIEWLDPSDAGITWEWDDMHMPGALSALAGDYACVIASGMAYGHLRMGTPVEMRIRIWNGYAYFGLATDVPEAEQAAMWERRTEAERAAIKSADAYWREQAVPELRAALRVGGGASGRNDAGRRPRRDLGRGVGADRALLVDPFLRHSWAVPGPRGPRRPVRVGHRGAGSRRGPRTDRWRRP